VILACVIGWTLTSLVDAREWTHMDGRKIQAEMTSVKGAEGAEIAVLRLQDGRSFDVALAQLSEADREFVLQQKQSVTQEAGDRAPASIFKEMLDGKLVSLSGKRVAKYQMEQDPEYYAFYFTASWCGPCKAFTPNLVQFYESQPGKKKSFEVITVSRDSDESSMEDYIKSAGMPWPAIQFRSVDRLKEINQYAGKGIPCLVLVDGTGKVLSHSYEGSNYVGPTKVMRDLEGLLNRPVKEE